MILYSSSRSWQSSWWALSSSPCWPGYMALQWKAISYFDWKLTCQPPRIDTLKSYKNPPIIQFFAIWNRKLLAQLTHWPRGWNLFYQSEWFKWGALKLESQCVISGYTKLSSNCCQNVVKLWTPLSQKCQINNFDHHPTMTNMNIDPALLQPPGVRTFSTTSIFSPPPCTRFQFNFLLV